MSMTKRRLIMRAVHKTARGLHDAGVMGIKTMREIDALCLPRKKKGGRRD